jgi:hypothetical protein
MTTRSKSPNNVIIHLGVKMDVGNECPKNHKLGEMLCGEIMVQDDFPHPSLIKKRFRNLSSLSL